MGVEGFRWLSQDKGLGFSGVLLSFVPLPLSPCSPSITICFHSPKALFTTLYFSHRSVWQQQQQQRWLTQIETWARPNPRSSASSFFLLRLLKKRVINSQYWLEGMVYPKCKSDLFTSPHHVDGGAGGGFFSLLTLTVFSWASRKLNYCCSWTVTGELKCI